jgi:molecular chaperone GrpE
MQTNEKKTDVNAAAAADAEATSPPAAESPASSSPAAPAPPEAAPGPSPEEILQLKAEAARAKEYWDRLLRTAADFDNFKKRVAREREDVRKYAHEALLRRLIPVLDGFDAALAATATTADPAAQSLQTGITMIHQQFKAALAEAGLEEIDATGQPFDHNWHEAVSEQETADAPEGHVVQQLRKGYKLRDRLLRPAGVIVAKKPAAPPPAG